MDRRFVVAAPPPATIIAPYQGSEVVVDGPHPRDQLKTRRSQGISLGGASSGISWRQAGPDPLKLPLLTKLEDAAGVTASGLISGARSTVGGGEGHQRCRREFA